MKRSNFTLAIVLFLLLKAWTAPLAYGQTSTPKATLVYNSETYISDHPYNCNLIYFLPKNQTLDATYNTRLSAIMLYFQNWVKRQMAASGYGDKTFGLFTKQSDPSSVLIHFIQGKKTAASYPYANADTVQQEIRDYFLANPQFKNSIHTLVIMPVPDISKPDVPFYGIGPTAFALDYPEFKVEKIGQKGEWSGATLHELLHGLNLDHCLQTLSEERNVNQGEDIMSVGYASFGRTPTFLNRAGCAILNTSQTLATNTEAFYTGNTSSVSGLTTYYENGILQVSGSFQSTRQVTDVNIFQEPYETPQGGAENRVAWSVRPNGSAFTVNMATKELRKLSGPYNMQVELVLANGEVARFSYPFSYSNGVPTLNFFTKVSALSESASKLSGAVIGTTGSLAGNASVTKDKVFDGNVNTYFDGASANGQWAGLDLGSQQNIIGIKFRPRSLHEFRMAGGKFQISTDPEFTNPITLYQIPNSPALSFTDYYIACVNPAGVSARYIRYLSPNGGYGNIAEMTVYKTNSEVVFVRSPACTSPSSPVLGAVVKGSPGSWSGSSETTKHKVFDGNVNTYFDGASADGQWAGLDLGSQQNITCIKFRPRNSYESRMAGGKFQISTDSTFTNPVTVYQIPENLTLSFADYYITSVAPGGVSARYIRYLSPNGGYGNIAEMTVYKAGPETGFVKAAACIGPSSPVLGAVVKGSPGSWSGSSETTKHKVFDGNVNTYFDGASADGQWAGLDLGSQQNITCIKFRPRNSYESRMAGGKFQISTDSTFTNPVTVYQIPESPTLSFSDYYITSIDSGGVSARYIRYLSPNGGYGNIAEMTVYKAGPETGFVKAAACIGSSSPVLGAVVKGSPGSWPGPSETTKHKVFDGNVNTYFDGASADGQWAGLDLGSQQDITCIKFRPRNSYESRMAGGKFQISTDSAFTNPVTVYQIPESPTLSFNDYYITSVAPGGVSARYIRYLSPNGGYGNIAEMTVYKAGPETGFVKAAACIGSSSPVSGAVVKGSPGSWSGSSETTKHKVFDGNVNTYFDGASADGQWAGLDLGSQQDITCIKFRPRNSYESRMAGGKFQISTDSAFTNPVTVYQIPESPTLSFNDYYITSVAPGGVSARYIRYLSPNGGYGNIAEMTVYKAGPETGFVKAAACTGSSSPVSGAVVKGSPGSWSGSSETTKHKVFDGNVNTYFDGASADGQWAGLDLGSQQNITCIKFRPRNSYESRMAGGKFQISTDSAFTNPVTVYQIPESPTLSFNDYYITSVAPGGVSARYIRYLSPNGGYGNIAEMTVYRNTVSARLATGEEAAFQDDAAPEDLANGKPVLYPNPVRNIFSVDESKETVKTLVIYNLHGQKLLPRTIRGGNVDISNFSSGSYIIKLNGKYTYRIQKID